MTALLSFSGKIQLKPLAIYKLMYAKKNEKKILKDKCPYLCVFCKEQVN
jgi:hypothetical protein